MDLLTSFSLRQIVPLASLALSLSRSLSLSLSIYFFTCLMSAAIGAPDLGADNPAGPVLDPHERSGHLGVERWPAAARVELGFRLVELGAAAGAVKRALFGVELVPLPRAGSLGAGLAQDVKLFVCVCVFVLFCFFGRGEG